MSYQVVICPGCKFENNAGCRFCIGCGYSLEGSEPVEVEGGDLEELDPGGAAPDPDAEAHLRKIVEAAGFPHEARENGWKVTVEVGDGRTQTVHVRFGGSDEDGAGLVTFLSLCAAADERHAMSLLRLNAGLAHGWVAVVTIQGRECIAIRATQLAETADEEEVRKLLVGVARHADALEAKLRGGKDSF